MSWSHRCLDWIVRGLSRLVDWNARQSRARPVGLVAMLGFFASGLLLCGYIAAGVGFESAPNPRTDELDYDSLGWELSQGRGFRTDYSAPAFRDPYELNGQPPPMAGPRIGLYRPPLYPWLLSLTNRVFGRQFTATRAWNVACTSMWCGLVAALVYQLGGPAPAALAGVNLLLVDWRVRFNARSLLTESLAAGLVLLLTLVLLRQRRRPSVRTAMLIGLLTGLSVLNRSICVLWLPFVAWLALPGDAATSQGDHPPEAGRCTRRRWIYPSLVVAVALAVLTPWMARNIGLLGWRFPLGTQAALEAPAGYGDGALRRLGLWINLHPDLTELDRLDQSEQIADELNRAVANKQQAVDWALAHWHQLPLLAAVKVASELRPWGIGELYVSVFALLGLLRWRTDALAGITISLLAACLFGIALTWSTAGRFLVPLLPNLHLFAALGLWGALSAVVRGTTEVQ